MALAFWRQAKGSANSMISIIKTSKYWFVLSSILVGASIVFLLTFGLKSGIDFTGGSIMELKFTESIPAIDEIQETIKKAGVLENMTVQTLGSDSVIVRFRDVTQEEHQKILTELKTKYADTFSESRFDSIGPNIGKELGQKTIRAVIIAILAIIAYIAWAFRKISKPVESWKYGVIAAIALFHDVIITVGLFSLFGKFFNMEVNAPFIAAILTILGYSVNDTIVIFDRIRENLLKYYRGDLAEILDRSVRETCVRSMNASMTVLLTLFAILFFGGSTIRDFALALIIGIGVGTYSSIFLATPLLLVVEKMGKKMKK